MKSKLIMFAKAILVMALALSNVYCLVTVRKMDSNLGIIMPEVILHIRALEEWAVDQIAKEKGKQS
jgi:hypothetical protein